MNKLFPWWFGIPLEVAGWCVERARTVRNAGRRMFRR
jgi:hypothetical protein